MQAARSFQLVSTGIFPLKNYRKSVVSGDSRKTAKNPSKLAFAKKLCKFSCQEEGTKNNNPKFLYSHFTFFAISFVKSRIVLRSTKTKNSLKK